MSQTAPTIDYLLSLAAERPADVLAQLQTHRSLAAAQDAHGYSLVHAAASYGHGDLLRALITEFGVDANITDEDAETALFSVEEVPMAALLLELGTDPSKPNVEGVTAEEKLAEEDEQPAVAAFLQQRRTGAAPTDGETAAMNGEEGTSSTSTASSAAAPPPPRLPDGVRINVGTMREADVGEAPDPEFRRRIEELAAREDFDQEEGQRELRNLITDAVSGLTGESGQGPATRVRRDY